MNKPELFKSGHDEDNSRAELLKAKMMQVVYGRKKPTRFEYETEDGNRVAVWFDRYGKQADEENYDRFNTYLENGELSLIPEDSSNDDEEYIKALCKLFVSDLKTTVKINDTWFDRYGKQADEENYERFENQMKDLPLTKII